MEKRIGRVKVRKLMSGDKNSLMMIDNNNNNNNDNNEDDDGDVRKRRGTKREKIRTQERQVMQMRTIAHHQPTNAQPLPRQQLPPPPPPTSLLLLLLSTTSCGMVWNIPLVSWGQLSRLCPSQLLVPPSLLAGGWGERQKRP